MSETVLVTGGCGFIGRHVCRTLLRRGYRVRVLDALIEQVHGTRADRTTSDVDLVVGDIRDEASVETALRGAGSVIHLASEVGVGQSMYEIARYVGVNDLGTGVLLDALARKPVRRVVVASSMSIYGEGLYRNARGEHVQLEAGQARQAPHWDPVDADGGPLRPVPTPEWKQPALASVYALTKFVQEQTTLVVCPPYGMEGVALRLFNVFGPGQALSNPYTGVLAIFASRLLNGKRPLVFEDGNQRRDFVHVSDVAEAFALALERPEAVGRAMNIASGESTDIANVARLIAKAMGRPDLEPDIMQRSRIGDIRHCFADISLAREALGFAPRCRLDDATLTELADWVARCRAVDGVSRAHVELESRGLIV